MSLAITVCVCLVFTAVGPTLILTNKYLMSRCKFPYPILLTCSGQISSSVISFFLVRVFKVVPLTPMPWPVYFRSVSTVGLVACLAMASGNYTYLYLTVSFIEILKGFTPVVTIMVQAVFGQASPRPIAGVAVLMISLGTSISSFGEIDLNLLGLSLMLGSIYCEAMRLMLTQRLLQDMRMHVLVTLYYLSPATLLWLMPLAYLVDVRKMDVPAVLAAAAQLAPLRPLHDHRLPGQHELLHGHPADQRGHAQAAGYREECRRRLLGHRPLPGSRHADTVPRLRDHALLLRPVQRIPVPPRAR
jgi:drug/metabolite transporter (DMT)-like permease